MMHSELRRRSATLAAMLAGSVALSACAVGPTAAEVAACQPPRAGGPADADLPTLDAVVGIDHPADGVLLLAAPLPGDATLLYLNLCRYERRATVVATDAAGGTVEASVAGALSVDRQVEVAAAPGQRAVGGRILAPAVRVEVVLETGQRLEAVVRNGYWIAWWPGAGAVSAVRALDASGAEVASVPHS